MCGISGIHHGDLSKQQWQMYMYSMTDRLIHRGPDDSGHWHDIEAGIGLGHRRLSIVDLSRSGGQPMISASGRYVIAYNGEVYNYLKLRKELESFGHSFRGHSDTEVVLAAFEEWGLLQAVSRFIGMFAFALWDRKDRVLYLVRDRLGIKPLYYGQVSKGFTFASELKPFQALPNFDAEINHEALALLLQHMYIPAPHSIYKGICKLLPGHILTVRMTDNSDFDIKLQPFWCLHDVLVEKTEEPFTGSEEEAVDELERLLSDAVRMRMLADVPLGALLSGGIDSSTVVAFMQKHTDHPVKTFTIGFYENSYNEATYAKAVAQYLGTEHTELYVTPDEAMAVIPRLPELYDEPFADSSQIPTFLVSQLAREQVKVSLTGDGGDELFGGYPRYMVAQDIWKKIGWMPVWARQVIGKLLLHMPVFGWGLDQKQFNSRLRYAAEIFLAPDKERLYTTFISHWRDHFDVVKRAQATQSLLCDQQRLFMFQNYLDYMMQFDTLTYLPDDILTKVDRASMGVSLETRVPILDHRVVEFAWRLPLHLKIRHGEGKWILRQVLSRYVPNRLIERPKMGFGVPIGRWLCGPLRPWAESLLDAARLRQEGFFKTELILQKWEEHISGKRNWQHALWNVLMFQAWLENRCSHG